MMSDMQGYSAKILLDSVSPFDARLTTWELTYPRFVHAELMTHRVFSRNSASSRAIPVTKLMDRIRSTPVEPLHWGKNQKGMQAKEELQGTEREVVRDMWLDWRDEALRRAERISDAGLHKQIANRPLEAWMFITVIVSTTHHGNWFGLRDHADAQPELAWVASEMRRLQAASEPRRLSHGEWHMPMLFDFDDLVKEYRMYEPINPLKSAVLRKISVGRLARVSYLTHDGIRDPKADFEKHDELQRCGHMSPFEHVAEALTHGEWIEYADEAARKWRDEGVPVGNFWGWRQYRKTLPGESVFGGGPQ